MSDKQRWPLAEADSVADDLRYALALSTCERVAVAGSIRRRKSEVGDIEILFIPKMATRQKDMFTTEEYSLADELIEAWLERGAIQKRPSKDGRTAWGPKNKLAIHTESGIHVDFFSTTNENWNVALVVRTGSKETNLRLTSGAIARGGSLLAYGAGVRHSDGTVTPATSERHVFELCGVPYLEPGAR